MLTKLRKLYLKYKLRKLLAVEIPEYEPNRKLLESLINTLDPTLFTKYTPSFGLSITIISQYPDIGEYLLKLRKTTYLLKKNDIIPSTWAVEDNVTLSLDRWLMSNGYYSSVVNDITDYKKNVVLLCELLKESDGAMSGINASNLRMLTKMVINLTNLTKQLIVVSLL